MWSRRGEGRREQRKKWRGPVDSCGGGEENKGKEKKKNK
jgi:hypothetical protein